MEVKQSVCGCMSVSVCIMPNIRTLTINHYHCVSLSGHVPEDGRY